MKHDLDRLMHAASLDALLVTGPGRHNPPMVYLSGGANLTSADLVRRRDAEPVLFYRAMERDEAAQTGLQTRCLDDYNLEELLRQAGGDMLQATALRYARLLTEMGLQNARIGLSGQMDAGLALALFTRLQVALPGLELVGQATDTILMATMATKEPQEVERIRRMGQVTVEVVGQVADFLSSQRARDGVLIFDDGQPVTIADVKRRINLWLSERGAENPEETIFAIGSDAGVPHSVGSPADVLRLGQTIVFDIFPREAGGGYFYDFTRTWCLGYAPDEVQALYDDVYQVYQQVTAALRLDAPFGDYQALACDLFEARGHPTQRSRPMTQQGYVHGLGHGVGLHVHERPFARLNGPNGDRLAAGSIMTIEPGLYYPERGLGVRLEDTYWVQPDGQIGPLASYPLDLVLPVRQ